MPNIKVEALDHSQEEDFQPKLKPFTGRLAALKIQPEVCPDVKSDHKFQLSSISQIKIEPKCHDDVLVDPPAEIKPKLEPFTSKSLEALPIRPFVHQDVKLRWRQKNFTCDLCKKSIGTRSGLLYHMRAHINGRPFKCDICHRSYATKNDFNTHQKRHSGIKFNCHFCSKTYNAKQYLADHITARHFPKIVKCTFCSLYFSTAHVLNQHLHSSHPHSAFCKPTYTCNFCGYTALSKKNITKHLSSAIKMRFQCKICLQKFPCKKLSGDHTRLKKSKLIKCNFCNKMCSNIDTHLSAYHRSIPCKYCPYVAPNQNLSSAHLRVCKNRTEECRKSEGLYCADCDLSFPSNIVFSTHRNKVHGQFQCQKCKATFFVRNSLLAHLRRHKKRIHTIHTDLKKNCRCLICPTSLRYTERQLVFHMKTEHAIQFEGTTKKKFCYWCPNKYFRSVKTVAKHIMEAHCAACNKE